MLMDDAKDYVSAFANGKAHAFARTRLAIRSSIFSCDLKDGGSILGYGTRVFCNGATGGHERIRSEI